MKKKVMLIIFVLATLVLTTGNTALSKPLAKETHHIEISIYKDDNVTFYDDDDLVDMVDTAMGAIADAVSNANHEVTWTIEGPIKDPDVQMNGCLDMPDLPSGKTSIFFTQGELNQNGFANQNGGNAYIDLALDTSPGGCADGMHQYINDVAVTHELGHVFGANHENHSTCTDEYNTKELPWTDDGCGSEGWWEYYTHDSMEEHDMHHGYIEFAWVNADRIYDYVTDNY